MPQIKRRSPIPPSNFSVSPNTRSFLPPSHYAAAAGVPYYQSSLRVKVPQGSENSDNESSSCLFMTTSPRDTGSFSLRRNTLLPISYPTQPVSSDSFESDALVESGANSPIATTKSVSTPSPRPRRRSNLGDLPLVEAHLLPSLRDTIDRMTRSPARTGSATSSSSDSPACDKRSRSSSVSTTESMPTTPSVRQPFPPQVKATQGLLSLGPEPIPFAANCTPVETSTPKQNSKVVLKSALKSPTPKWQVQQMDPPSSSRPPSLAMSLRSVKSIIGTSRKVPSLAKVNISATSMPAELLSQNEAAVSSLAKLNSKNLSGNGKIPAARPGRMRSRTDPGTPLKMPSNSTQSTPTPQLHCTASKLTSRIEGQPQHDDRGLESELEYRFEMEARERRRLVVTNASVMPSSSESEGEYAATTRSFRTRLPVLAGRAPIGKSRNEEGNNTFGLGFDFGKNQSEIHSREYICSSLADDDDSSVYDDQEPEADKTTDSIGYSADHSCFSSQSRLSIDKLDEAHRRRREALIGIVSGLEAGLGTTFADDSRNEESDYCGQEGLAISGSGNVRGDGGELYTVQGDQSYHRSLTPFVSDRKNGEYQQESCDRRTIPLTTPPESLVEDKRRISSGGAEASLLQAHVLISVSRGGAETGYENATELPVNNKRTSRSPIIRTSTGISLPTALGRHSVYDARDPNSTGEDRHEFSNARAGRNFGNQATIQAESLHAVAAREREALGIPPSESDKIFRHNAGHETGVMAHTDSVLSSVNSSLWIQDSDQLSMGAEELFRRLSGKSDHTSSEQANSDTGHTWSSQCNSLQTKDTTPSEYILRNSYACPTNATPFYENSDADLTWQDHEDCPASDPPLIRDKGHAKLSTVAICPLLRQYGELETDRQKVIRELWATEKAFVENMRIMVGLFIRPLRVKSTRIWISGVPPSLARLFDWLEDILNLHKQILSVLQTSLTKQSPIVERIAAPLRNLVARFEVYQPYMVRIGDATDTIKALRQDSKSDFGEFVRIQEKATDCNGWNMEIFLTEPLNRLESYLDRFRRLRDLTPKNHPDFLPTLSLFYSTSMVMRVLDEVKTRENQYRLVKDILASIRGLPPSIQLAKRERRLLAHGLLEQVEDAPQSSSGPPTSLPDLIEDHVRERGSKLIEAINEWDMRRGRAGSVKSTSSSATGESFKSSNSRSSASSSFPVTPSSECFPSRYSIASPSPKSKLDSGYASLDNHGHCRGVHAPPVSHPDTELKNKTAHVFVFSDVVLFTSPMPPGEALEDSMKWNLADEIGLAKVLSVSEDLRPPGPLIVLDILPVDADNLVTGVIPDRSLVKTIRLSIPGDTSSTAVARRTIKGAGSNKTSGGVDIRQKWISALEQCSQSTLRILSYQSLQSGGEIGHYLPGSSGADLEMDTRQSVRSILASGLPMPKSPSFQKEEEAKGVANDTAQIEREERGWWTLRFQQVLREMHRRDG